MSAHNPLMMTCLIICHQESRFLRLKYDHAMKAAFGLLRDTAGTARIYAAVMRESQLSG